MEEGEDESDESIALSLENQMQTLVKKSSRRLAPQVAAGHDFS